MTCFSDSDVKIISVTSDILCQIIEKIKAFFYISLFFFFILKITLYKTSSDLDPYDSSFYFSVEILGLSELATAL